MSSLYSSQTLRMFDISGIKELVALICPHEFGALGSKRTPNVREAHSSM